jgi:hypothetical protein
MNLEDDLRRALHHEPPPPNFAAKVLSRTRVVSLSRAPFWRRPVTFAAAAALALAALAPPAVYQYRKHQRAVEARDQLILALSITKVQLQHVKEKIHQNTRHKI